MLLTNCAAWPLLTGAAGLAANKKPSNNLMMFLPFLGGGASLDRIEITVPYSSLAKTTSMQAKATAIYSNNSREDVTGVASWTSSSDSIVSLAAGGTATAVSAGEATITASYSGKSARVSVTVTPAPLTGVSITCVNSAADLPVLVQRACSLTGNFADATHQDLTAIATWQSSSTDTATVTAQGVVTGVSPGSATISGSYGGRTAGLSVTVSGATILPGAAGLSITPADAALSVGETQQYSAEGIFSDGTHHPMTGQVTWAVDDTDVASFSAAEGEKGLLSAVSPGQANVQAQWYAAASTARVTVFSDHLVSISIAPIDPLPNGATANLVATGHFQNGSTSDITTQVTWSSDSAAIATVDNGAPYQGRVTATAASGSTTIRAAVGGIEGTTTVSVTGAVLDHLVLRITDDNHSIAKDTSTYLTVEGINTDGTSSGYVTASALVTSSDSSVVSVSTVEGGVIPLNGLSAGSVTITASYGGRSGTTNLAVTNATLSSIAITPVSATIAVGETQSFTATGTFSNMTTQDLTRSVTWTSSNTAVATISMSPGSEGVATALTPGSSSSITASQGSVTSPSATLIVSGEKILTSIAVSTDPVGTTSIAKGMTVQFRATGTYSDLSTADLTDQVGWDTSDHALAVVNASGLATGVGVTPGVTISATMSGRTGSYSLAVTAAELHHLVVTLSDLDHSIAKNTATYATAEGINTDGTSAGDLTASAVWTSTPGGIVTVGSVSSGHVVLTGAAAGTATIQATYSGRSGSTTLSVTNATLSSIQVTPMNPTIGEGETQVFTATGIFSDGTSQDLTRSATWVSSNVLVATISNATGYEGLATAVSPGSTTNITATQNSITSAASVLTVSGTKRLTSISITTTRSSIAKGTDTQLTATGSYSDGSTADITASVSWSSGAPGVATVGTSALVGSTPGLVHGEGDGTATLTASFTRPDAVVISSTFDVTVTAAELVSIQVDLAATEIARGTSTTGRAMGTYTDGSTQNISGVALFTSDAPGTVVVGTVNTGAAPAYPNVNLTSPKSGTIGAAHITASYNPGSGPVTSPPVTVTVGAAALDRVEVYCPSLSTVVGLEQNCQATGILTDDSTQDLTGSATWVSSNPSVAGIDSSLGATNGRLTALVPGDTNITASAGGKTSVAVAVHVVAKVLESITLAPAPTLNLPRGTTQQFAATGHYNDGTSPDITSVATWSSSESDCVAISATGLAQAVSGLLGYLTCNATSITASHGGGVGGTTVMSAATVVDVTAPTLQSITIEPGSGDLARGLTQQYTATGTYSDGSTQTLTNSVSWSSSNTSAATVTSGGLLTAVAAGSTTVTALDAGTGTSASVSLNVTAATIVSISVGPTNPTIHAGAVNNTVQMAATGRYSDYPSTPDADVTASVIWSTSSPTVATVSNASGSEGLVTSGTSTGTTTITATLAGASSGATTVTVVADTTVPTVQNVTSIGALVVRVTFSEPMNTAEATNPENYRVALSSAVTGLCSDGTNFSAAPAALAVGSITPVSSSIFDLNLSAAQTGGTNYTLLVNRSGVHDLGVPTANLLGCPNTGSFVGLEQLRVSSAVCADTTHIIATFSKPVRETANAAGSAACTGGTECSYRYKVVGPKDLGNITSARLLDGEPCGALSAPADTSKVCITHSVVQTGAFFSIIAANGANGDGFDNPWGTIRDAVAGEAVQTSPRDRATFQGCGEAPVAVDDGPLVDDPFGDESDFGNLTDYQGMIYIGPNYLGNGATRFAYDGSSPLGISFTFTKDITGSRVSDNSGTNFVSIGHRGCVPDTVALSTACGPDNENGRGVFLAGTLGTTPYIFMAGARDPDVHGGSPDFSYIYYSSNDANVLNFRYLDLGTITGLVDAGASSMFVLNSRVYVGAAKRNPAGMNTPDLGFVTFNSGDTDLGACVPGGDCEASDGTRGRRFMINYMPYFGGSSQNTPDNSSPNYGYNNGVDTLFSFNGYLYAANGGYRQTGHNGSVLRSTTENPRAKCTGADTCADWTEIGPRTDSAWHGQSSNLFSLELSRLFDMIPADKAVSMFESFRERLYMTRTVCVTTNGTLTGFNAASPISDSAYLGCLDGTYGNRRPQLWKCDPANGGSDTGPISRLTCEANEWSLVGDDGTGYTNFGHAGNHSITMVKKNGDYLYVALDNESGLELWRTSSANPGSSSAVWEQVGTNGLNGDTLHVQQFFSAVSVQPVAGGPWYLYLSVGKNGVPVKVYRQQND